MALSEWELWACANRTIQDYGFDAPIRAAMRADKLLERGDLDGAAAWRSILRRINDILGQSPGGAN